MARINPFKALRPRRDLVHLVASRPFYSYKKNVLEAKLEDNQFTFMHIINPEFGSKPQTKPNSPERFQLVAEGYSEFIKKGIFVQEKVASFYIYRQSKGENVCTGIICGASVNDYKENATRKHEATLTSRERIFTEYLDIVGYNAEPVLLTHPNNDSIDAFVNERVKDRAEYEFTTTDFIKHELWVIPAEYNYEVQGLFAAIPNLYIADGHHRSASSVGLADMRSESDSSFENENFFLSYIVPESNISILEFNRLVRNIGNKTAEQILIDLHENFEVTPLEGAQKPENEHEFTMCLRGNWYSLSIDTKLIDEDHPVNSLDAELLTQYVLDPILDIQDLKSDDNISFISGAESLEKIESKVTSKDYDIAFVLYPVEMSQVVRVADNNMIMPPKSTWVEPKLRSGLTIYNINE